MVDNDIKKALECCINWKREGDCAKCPLYQSKDLCLKILRILSLNYINRLEAEVEQYKDYNAKWIEKCEELKAENERLKLEKADIQRDLQIVCDNSISVKLPHCVLCGKGAILTKSLKDYDELIGDISAEAYKEFAERLRKEFYYSAYTVPIITEEDLDNLLKELVGDLK